MRKPRAKQQVPSSKKDNRAAAKEYYKMREYLGSKILEQVFAEKSSATTKKYLFEKDGELYYTDEEDFF
jgi:hypothetical protein